MFVSGIQFQRPFVTILLGVILHGWTPICRVVFVSLVLCCVSMYSFIFFLSVKDVNFILKKRKGNCYFSFVFPLNISYAS